MDFDQKVVAITGGAQGIGRALVEEFSSRGAHVALLDINESEARTVVEAIEKQGGRCYFFPFDLTRDDPHRVIQNIKHQVGPIDVLINNARAGKRLSFADETRQNWDLTMDVSLNGTFFLSQACADQMELRKQGSIINICSIAGTHIGVESPSYHVAKSGLIHLTKYMAMHLGPSGIRVNAVVPAFLLKDEHKERFYSEDNELYRTVFNRCSPMRRPATTEEICKAVCFLASSQASYISGTVLPIDGGLHTQDPSILAMEMHPGIQ